MRSQKTKSIRDVIIVLGKRLKHDELTAEGKSRVDALTVFLKQFDLNHTALVFCGGITRGQRISEAEAMFTHYSKTKRENITEPALTLLETESTNTIENVQNAAIKLIESGMCAKGEAINVVFVSNDYHLQRIFQVQKLLAKQGLLKVLIERCYKAGLPVDISLDESDHCCVPYPHQGVQGQLFLALDELTVYRVYLEGVVREVFDTPLAQLREQPYRIAKKACRFLNSNLSDDSSLQKVQTLEEIIEKTRAEVSRAELKNKLALFHKELTALNRLFDPESGQTVG